MTGTRVRGKLSTSVRPYPQSEVPCPLKQFIPFRGCSVFQPLYRPRVLSGLR